MPTTDNIAEFWRQVDDPLFWEEMVFSKIAMVAKKAIGQLLHNKHPTVDGHLFTMEECTCCDFVIVT